MDAISDVVYWTPALPGQVIIPADNDVWYVTPVQPGGWDARQPYEGPLDGLTRYPPEQAEFLSNLIGAAFDLRTFIARPTPQAEVWHDPTDLITISEAARLVGRHPNTVSSLVDQGRLQWWPPMTPGPNPRKGARLVSKTQVLERWPILLQVGAIDNNP